MSKPGKGNGRAYAVNVETPMPGYTHIYGGCLAIASPVGNTPFVRVTAQWWVSDDQQGTVVELIDLPGYPGTYYGLLDTAPYEEFPDFYLFEVRFVAYFQGRPQVPQTITGVKGFAFPTGFKKAHNARVASKKAAQTTARATSSKGDTKVVAKKRGKS